MRQLKIRRFCNGAKDRLGARALNGGLENSEFGIRNHRRGEAIGNRGAGWPRMGALTERGEEFGIRNSEFPARGGDRVARSVEAAFGRARLEVPGFDS